MNTQYIVSTSPHVKDRTSVLSIMWSVVFSLVPVWVGAVYFMGLPALYIPLLAIVSAVVTEVICQKMMNKKVTINDGSAVLTGLLLAFTLPPMVPIWIPIVGSVFSIAIGKQVFGGLGNNPMNPALLGRAFLMASWPVHITSKWAVPTDGTLSGINAVTGATPLGVLKDAMHVLADPTAASAKVVQAEKVLMQLSDFSMYTNLFVGRVGGSIGETSAVLLALGGIYLLFKRYIEWRLPLMYIGTVALFGWIFGGPGKELFQGDALFHVLSGGLMLGAIYMATDMVSSPLTNKGKAIFGFGSGLITIIIRLKGGYPEGVCYSILLMNLTVPLIDRYTKPRKFGEVRV